MKTYEEKAERNMETKARGNQGSWLVLTQWETESEYPELVNVKAVLVDGDTIKADTWYSLIAGQVVEVES